MKMYRVLLTAIALLIAALPLHVLAGETLYVPFLVSDGQQFGVAITKERIQKKDGETQVHYKSSTTMGGVIDEVGQDNIRITWTPLSTSFQKLVEPKKKPPFSLEELAAELSFPYRLVTDEFGNPIKMENRKELEAAMMSLLDRLPQPAKIKEFVASQYFGQSDEQFVRTFFQEAVLIGQGQSLALERGETVKETSKQPNPLGGPPIDYIVAAQIVSEDDEFFTVQTLGEFEPQSAKDSFIALVTSMAQKTGKPVASLKKELEELAITRNNEVLYKISKSTGWTSSILVQKDTTVTNRGLTTVRLDIWNIEVSAR